LLEPNAPVVGVAAVWFVPPAAGVVLPKLNFGALASPAVVVGAFPKSEDEDVAGAPKVLPKEKPAGLLASAMLSTRIDAVQGCKVPR
jgi:hypothetical protein